MWTYHIQNHFLYTHAVILVTRSPSINIFLLNLVIKLKLIIGGVNLNHFYLWRGHLLLIKWNMNIVVKNYLSHFLNQSTKDYFFLSWKKTFSKNFILTTPFMILVFNWYICLLHFSSSLALRNSFLQIFKGESHFNIM